MIINNNLDLLGLYNIIIYFKPPPNLDNLPHNLPLLFFFNFEEKKGGGGGWGGWGG